MAEQGDWRDASTRPSHEGAPDDTTWALGFTDAAAPDMFPEAGTSPSAIAPSQIVFIEGSVAGYQILADGVQPGVKVVILNPDANGVQQIADYLQHHDTQNLSAISIVADGADGEIQLGNTLLSASNIADYQQQLAAIGAALKPGGDLLLYGCDVAQNGAGDAFLGDLATATGVGNIAAASHVVGSAAEGGSFNLDVDLGNAAAATGPFTAAAVAAYPDLLGITSNLVWYITTSTTTSQSGVYTIDVNGNAAATSPDDIASSPAAPFVTVDGLAIDPSAGVYFAASYSPTGPFGDTNQIFEGNISGGTPSVIYTSGNSGGDAIVGLAFDQLNGLLYMAVTDANIGSSDTDTGIYTISALGSGTRTATKLVNLSSGTQAPNDIAIDTTNNLLFYTNGVPGLTSVEEVGVANLSTGAIINSDLVSYSSSGNVEPYGIAVNPTTDTLYWTTVNSNANSGNAIYSANYTTGASVNLSNTQTLATTSQAQTPFGISLDVPANGYYVDTSTGVSNDTTPTEILFGSSLTSPETLTDVYNVPGQDGGAETLLTEGIVVEVQPVVAASGTVTFVHGESAVAIDSGATVSDADGYYLASATVSIASGLGTGDTLNFTNQNGITGSFSSGTLTLTGATSAANYQTALDSVTFSTTSSSTTPRTIDWTVSDSVVSSATDTSTVDIHVAPTVIAGATVTFDGGGSPVALDSGLTVSDTSSSTLVGASVTIVSETSTDRLNFTNQGGITGSYNTSNGVLTLTGNATVGAYQAALESITYSVNPTDSDPTDGGSDTSRTIDWTVNDGVLSSSAATSTVDTVHVAPTITAGGTVTFDGGGGAVALDPGLTATDVDSGGVLSSATVTIAGAITGDTLNFTNSHPSTEGNIAVSSDSNGVLVLTSTGSTATLLQWETALESVSYSFTTDGDPTGGGSHTSRTIDWVVSDGSSSHGTSNTSTSTLDTVHEPPTVTAGGTVDFTGGSGAEIALDSGLALADPDSDDNIVSATVTVGGYLTGDTLSVGTAGGLATRFSNGTLTLSGTASLATYQAALDTVDYTFTPTDGDPTGGGSDNSRSISWEVNDGVATGSGSSALDVIHVAPTVTAGGSATYPENSAPVALDPGLTVTDPDSGGNLIGVTVSISSGFLLGDTLNFTDQGGITDAYQSASGLLTLSGTASIANYDTALDSITYSFSGDPTDGGTDKSRTISWVANDGVSSSAVADSTLRTTVCFCAGTRIATERGEVLVEALREGDRVVTHDGKIRPIVWIGQRRLDVTRHPDPRTQQPVRIRRGAIAEGAPHRDLLVSPDHAVFLDGLLIPARLLVNAMTITHEVAVRTVRYFHVELDRHAVLLAEGLGCESYLDTGNRSFFQNGQPPMMLHPRRDEADDQRRRVAESCAPFADDAARVEPIWRRLAERAGALGFDTPFSATTADPALHVMAGGRAIQAVSHNNDRYIFVLPPLANEIRLISRAAAPCDTRPWIEDRRHLGVTIRRIVLRRGAEQIDIALDDPRLEKGWWAVERDGTSMWRWTNGDAVLPLAGEASILEIHVAGNVLYPMEDDTALRSRCAEWGGACRSAAI